MSASGGDEARLWDAARAGDGDALAQIFDLHGQRVYRHALRLLGDRHDAEDASAIAFLELWRVRARVRVVDGSVLAWLLVTTTNAARNVRRSGRRYRALIAALPREAPAESAADRAEFDGAVLDHVDPRLAEALRALPSGTAALVALTVLEGCSVAEAAAATGLSVGAAKTRLSRARATLRDALPDLDPAGDAQEARHG
ncbi:RNA polymerase sigma factor [Demequina soli]|uniref:RNA polymerase sigma factor n=1 Tax=Demequina soli TaxID=1638987 RepID=UPI0007846D88|nr:RNA polymerase sigma factor [Demequina soli]